MRRPPRAWFGVLLAGCGSSASGFGAGADSGTFDLDAPQTLGQDATKQSEAGTIGDGASSTSGGGDGGSCSPRCSADLHSVLDCNGQVVKTCPLTEGCSGSSCVSPCDSASANQSSIGCDYYAVAPGLFVEQGTGQTFCYAAFVANTWGAPLTVGVDYDGMTLNPATFGVLPKVSGSTLTYTPLTSGQVPPGDVAILFLASGGASCPGNTKPAIAGLGQIDGTGTGSGFHVTTSVPSVVYDMFPYGGAASAITSATLLLPTSVWDTNYVALDGYPESSQMIAPGAQPFLQFVAEEDATTISILPSAAIVGGTGVPSAPVSTTQTYSLQKGQVLQFAQDAELIGSAIQSNHPIGVWGGNTCMNIDVGETACDSAHQQIFPVKALGNEYVASRYRDRIAGQVESPPWHIVGAADGTVLTYDPPTPPTGAPTTLSTGQVALFSAEGPFTVRSQDAQHPFNMAAHMTGWSHVANNLNNKGDPEFVNLIPPAQYLSDYVFFTDPTYDDTNLVFVRQKTSAGTFADVSLDCVGVLTGWTAVGTGGNFEYTRVDVSIDGTAQGMCTNGRHEAKSIQPFGLTVWGWGFAVSYAYPAGASVRPINTVIVSTTQPK